MQDEDAIRQQIKITCMAKGYTRYQLAKECAISYSSVCRFLDGKVGVTFYMLNTLCDVLGIPWKSLLDDRENRSQMLSEEEKQLIFSLRHLNSKMQAAVYNLVATLGGSQMCLLGNA